MIRLIDGKSIDIGEYSLSTLSDTICVDFSVLRILSVLMPPQC